MVETARISSITNRYSRLGEYRMNIVDTDIKIDTCPFCGSTAHIVKTRAYFHNAYTCDKCRCKTTLEVADTVPLTGDNKGLLITDDKAIDLVIQRWNNRIA